MNSLGSYQQQNLGKYDTRESPFLNFQSSPVLPRSSLTFPINKYPGAIPIPDNHYNSKFDNAMTSPFRLMANQNILVNTSHNEKPQQYKGRERYQQENFPSPVFDQDPRGGSDNMFRDRIKSIEYNNKQILRNDREQRDSIQYGQGQFGSSTMPLIADANSGKQQENSPIMSRMLMSPTRFDAKFQQSIMNYLKYFPHLNLSRDYISTKNAELLQYLAKQEEELTNQAQQLSDKPSLQEQKIEHLSVVSQLRMQLQQQKQANSLHSRVQLSQGILDSVDYQQSDGFNVKLHYIEKMPHEVERIEICYGIFRKGDQLKTYRSTGSLPTIALNWKFNKAFVNFQEVFGNIYPTVSTFLYLDIKIFYQNMTVGKSWGWTLHTLFDDQKRLVQGGFKLPLYSKNHIPHAIFQTGIPSMSDCFIFLEVYLGTNYQVSSSLKYEEYKIPALHLQEKKVEQIEEDIAIGGFVEEHIKQKGVIKSTFQDGEMNMREYNARNRLKLIKNDATLQGWKQPTSAGNNDLDIEEQKPALKKEKSYLIQLPGQVNSSKDIFSQISQRMDDKKKSPILIAEPIQQEDPKLAHVDEEMPDEDKEDNIGSQQPNRKRSFHEIADIVMRSNSKREKSNDLSPKKRTDSTRSIHTKTVINPTSVSKTMRNIIDKLKTKGSQQNISLPGKKYESGSDSIQQSAQLIKSQYTIDQQMPSRKSSQYQGNDNNDDDVSDNDSDIEQQLRQHIDDDPGNSNSKSVFSSKQSKNKNVIQVYFSIKSMTNWKSTGVIYEARILDNQNQEIAHDSNQLSVLSCDKKIAQFNLRQSSFKIPESENKAKLQIVIRDVGECEVNLVQQGVFVNKLLELTLFKIGSGGSNKPVLLKQTIEVQIDFNDPYIKKDEVIRTKKKGDTQMELQRYLEPMDKFQINLLRLQGIQTINPLHFQAQICNGGSALDEDTLIQTFVYDSKAKVLQLAQVPMQFHKNLTQIAEEYSTDLHRIYLIITIKEQKSGKMEEIGWTFMNLFNPDGSEKSGEYTNLVMYKFPQVSDIHLADVKKLKVVKQVLSIRLESIS